jgi:hypothetical protein
MTCEACGAALRDGALFCGSCGSAQRTVDLRESVPPGRGDHVVTGAPGPVPLPPVPAPPVLVAVPSPPPTHPMASHPAPTHGPGPAFAAPPQAPPAAPVPGYGYPVPAPRATASNVTLTQLLVLGALALSFVFGASTLAYSLSSGSPSSKPARVILTLLATGLAGVAVYLTRLHIGRERVRTGADELSAASATLLITCVFAAGYGALQLLASIVS